MGLEQELNTIFNDNTRKAGLGEQCIPYECYEQVKGRILAAATEDRRSLLVVIRLAHKEQERSGYRITECSKHGITLQYWPLPKDHPDDLVKYSWQCPACIGERMAQETIAKLDKEHRL